MIAEDAHSRTVECTLRNELTGGLCGKQIVMKNGVCKCTCANFDAHCYQIVADSRIQLKRHKDEYHSDDPVVLQKRMQIANAKVKMHESFNDDQKLMHCLIADNLPLSIVESEWFQSICKLDIVRSRATYARTVLPRMYLTMRREVEAVLRDQISLSFQTDAWSDAFNNTYYQGLTGWCFERLFSNCRFVRLQCVSSTVTTVYTVY